MPFLRVFSVSVLVVMFGSAMDAAAAQTGPLDFDRAHLELHVRHDHDDGTYCFGTLLLDGQHLTFTSQNVSESWEVPSQGILVSDVDSEGRFTVDYKGSRFGVIEAEGRPQDSGPFIAALRSIAGSIRADSVAETAPIPPPVAPPALDSSLLRFAVHCDSRNWLFSDSEPMRNGGPWPAGRLVIGVVDDRLDLRSDAVVRQVLTDAASFAQAKCVEPLGYTVIRVQIRRGSPSSFSRDRFPPRPERQGILTLDHIRPWIEDTYPLAVEAFNATNMDIVFPPAVADVGDIRWIEYRNFEEEEEIRRQARIRAEYERNQQLALATQRREAEAARFRQRLGWAFLVGCCVIAIGFALSRTRLPTTTYSANASPRPSSTPSSETDSYPSSYYGDFSSSYDYASDYNNVEEVSRTEPESSPPSNTHEAEAPGWNWVTSDLFSKDPYHRDQQHNLGQADGSAGRYNPPIRDPLGVLLDSFTDGHKDFDAAKKAYDDGHAHGSSQKDSGCFLTTACVQARGLPDDCDVLSKARIFRDTYVAALPNGENVIRRYYEIAPRIVRAVNAAAGSQREWDRIYDEIVHAMLLIDNGDSPGGFDAYRAMCRRLEQRYLSRL